MTPVWGADEPVAAWVAAHIPGCERGFGKCRALGVFDARGQIVAGVVFHDWSPERGLIQVSCASVDPKWLGRRVFRAVGAYAFSVARLMIANTSENNTQIRRLGRLVGAREYILPDMWADGEAMILLTLSRDGWEAFLRKRGA